MQRKHLEILIFTLITAGAPAVRAADRIVCSADRFTNPPGIVANYDLFALDPDGGGIVKLTDTPRVWERHPCLVPGTKRVLHAILAGEDDSKAGLHSLDVTSGTSTPLVSGVRVGSIACSPDGRLVVFTHENGRSRSLHLVSAEGGSHRRLTSGTLFEDRPVFSRDGRHVYFLGAGDSGVYTPYSVVAGGGTPAKVAGAPSGGSAIDISPDGKILAEATYDPATETSAIHFVSLVGGASRQIESGVMIVEELYFSPDGKHLLLVADSQLHRMRIDGSERQVISEGLEASVGEAVW